MATQRVSARASHIAARCDRASCVTGVTATQARWQPPAGQGRNERNLVESLSSIDPEALVVASPPAKAAVEVVGEFVASELRSGPRLARVFTSPDVRKSIRFQGSQNPNDGEGVGGVFKGV